MTAPVTVTQADRALAELTRRGKGGKYDRDVNELAFLIAAHRTAAEAASAARIAELVRAVEMLRSYGCPACSGDCGSANPPVMTCPMTVAQEALARAKARPDAQGEQEAHDAEEAAFLESAEARFWDERAKASPDAGEG